MGNYTTSDQPTPQELILAELKLDIQGAVAFRDRLEGRAELVAGFSTTITTFLGGLLVLNTAPVYALSLPGLARVFYIAAIIILVAASGLSLHARWLIRETQYVFAIQPSIDSTGNPSITPKSDAPTGNPGHVEEYEILTLLKGIRGIPETQAVTVAEETKEDVDSIREKRIISYDAALKQLKARNTRREERLQRAFLTMIIGTIILVFAATLLGISLLTLTPPPP